MGDNRISTAGSANKIQAVVKKEERAEPSASPARVSTPPEVYTDLQSTTPALKAEKRELEDVNAAEKNARRRLESPSEPKYESELAAAAAPAAVAADVSDPEAAGTVKKLREVTCAMHKRPCYRRVAGAGAKPHNVGRVFFVCPLYDTCQCTWLWEDGTTPFGPEALARWRAYNGYPSHDDEYGYDDYGCDEYGDEYGLYSCEDGDLEGDEDGDEWGHGEGGDDEEADDEELVELVLEFLENQRVGTEAPEARLDDCLDAVRQALEGSGKSVSIRDLKRALRDAEEEIEKKGGSGGGDEAGRYRKLFDIKNGMVTLIEEDDEDDSAEEDEGAEEDADESDDDEDEEGE